MKVYRCAKCGHMAYELKGSKCPFVCCGEPMAEVVPGTTDAAVEKHVPAVTVEGSKVTAVVGSVEHPMLPAHYIEWIALETENQVMFAHLKPEQAPKAVFTLPEGETVQGVYAYCNLHSLWKA